MPKDKSSTEVPAGPGHTIPQPKVFISYSWTSPSHQERVRLWAERLIQEGIDVVLDIYDLKEGQDKYSFMERMVTDPDVTHVLVVCDKLYAEKADAKKAGVGTESQIISREVYEKVEQSKFIPLACEFSEHQEPCLPTFLKSRIWIDFSSLEAENENWERLVRVIYGKPLHQKPQRGTPPAYITAETGVPASPAIGKLAVLRQALMQGRKGLGTYRRDFLSACIAYADALRTRKQPEVEPLGAKILEDCEKLKAVRNQIVDWVLLESAFDPSSEFCEALIDFLEQLREVKSRPQEVMSWSESWFEAHSVFVYETFLYLVAALLKNNSYQVLHEVFTSHYLRPASERNGRSDFETFGCFYGHSEALQSVLAPAGKRLYSPAAELIKRQADRPDLPFSAVIEAELLVLLMAFIIPDVFWYPQTIHYASHSESSFFLRATQHRYFLRLAVVTGIDDADQLREAVKAGHERLNVKAWYDFHMGFTSFWNRMNMDKLDSLK